MKYFSNKKSLHISFCAYLVSNLLRVAAAAALNNLQTSLNIKDGLGATTVLIAFVTSLIFGIFIGPIVLSLFGYKVGIVSANFTISMYILTNMYASYYSLLPGALCYGIGRALFWVSTGTFIVVYTSEYCSLDHKKASEYFSLVNSLQFASVQSSQIFGNLVTFAILSFNEVEINPKNNLNVTVTPYTLFSHTTDSFYSEKKISEVCGANDCQDPDITNEKLSSYVTPNQETRFIIMGVLTSLCLLGAVLAIIFLPNVKGSFQKKDHGTSEGRKNEAFQDIEDAPQHGEINLSQLPESSNSFDKCSCSTSKTKTVKNKEKIPILAFGIPGKVVCSFVDYVCAYTAEFYPNALKESEVVKIDEFDATCSRILIRKIIKHVLETLKQFFQPHQLLLTPFQFQAGLNIAFISGEVTRAFVSCVYGVAKVGICMCFFGASSVCSSIIAGKISGKLGREYAIGLSFVISASFYFFCLFWVPNENSSIGIAFALLIAGGCAEAFLRTISSEVTLVHFMNEKSSAYVCWFVWTTIGMLTQYGWSTSLCVRTKLFVMLASLVLAIITCGTAELLHQKRSKKTDKSSNNKKN